MEPQIDLAKADHDWARRLLFVICLIVCVGLAFVGVVSASRGPQTAIDGDASQFTNEQIASFRRMHLQERITNAGMSLCAVALQGFLACALLHPSVVEAFRRRTTPNGRETTEEATRALATGR